MDKEDLYGTWSLVSYMRRAGTGETTKPFGEAPRGVLNYGRDGRMFALIVKDERPKIANPSEPTVHERAGLFDTMASYGGTFTVAGDKVTHHVDISWNATWTGTDQVRTVRLEGEKLFLTAVQDGFVFALVWERAAKEEVIK